MRNTMLLVLGLVVLAQGAQAQPTSPVAILGLQFSSGMVGVVAGTTARLNVVNVGSSTTSSVPCVLALAFLDSNGGFLKQSFVSLMPGKAAFLDFPQTDTQAGRIEIRAIGYNPLLAAVSTIPVPLSCNLVETLELFDTSTSKTELLLSDFKSLTPTPVL